MKGDLHTLKRVCEYGSKVMIAGCAVILAILAAIIILGAGSFFSEGFSDFLQDVLDVKFGTDSTEKVVSSYLQILAIFMLALITVFTIYKVMVSIHEEHSPFNEPNCSKVKRLAQIYLASAVVFAALEIIGGFGWANVCFMFFGCILLSVVLYIFALIVRYGAVLQNESDHTL